MWQWGLRLGGGLILMIGMGHILMPSLGYGAEAISGWTPEAVDHFYYLATYFICGALLSLGALALLFSMRAPTWESASFVAVMTGLWALRLGLETLYPVDLPIYFLDRPHMAVTGVLAVVVLGHAAAVFAAWRRFHETPSGRQRP